MDEPVPAKRGSPPRVILRPRSARPFFARHPWVYAGSVARIDPGVSVGDEVSLFSSEGQFIARGLFNPDSSLRVRLYRWEDAPLDDAFWRAQLERAYGLRSRTLGLWNPGRAFRLVASEGDFLSGLTVDRYDRWLVVQFSSRALASRSRLFLNWLLSRPGVEGAVVRWDRWIAGQEGVAEAEPVYHGSFPEGPIEIEEEGLRSLVDLRQGQKTGLYLDQRLNRLAAARYATGRSVLDLFCYSGGFGLAALGHGGAREVLGIDRSAPALEAARENARINQLTGATYQQAEVFEAVEALREEGRTFGMVICDPPRFTRSARELEDALRGYVKLNRAVIDLVEPGGVLVTCSCSGHVSPEDFLQVIARAAELAGRRLQVLERRGASPDHPIASTCLESEYLKCYILALS